MLGASVSVLPPRQKEGDQTSTGLRISKSLLHRLDEIADAENYSRNEVIIHFLRWALRAYETEKEEEAELEKKPRRGH